MFGKIGDALGGIGDVLGGIGDVAGKIGDLARSVMDSPFGGLLSMIFPGAGMALQAASQVGGMLDGLSNSVGGGERY